MPRNSGDAFEVQRHIRDRLFANDTQFRQLLGQYLMDGLTWEQPLVTTSPEGSFSPKARAEAQKGAE